MRAIFGAAPLYALLKGWRYAVLRKRAKRDSLRMKDADLDALFLYEHDLWLHDVLLSTDPALGRNRRDFMQLVHREMDGACAEGMDRQGRTVLHHAVLRDWGIDDIAWAVSIFPEAAGTKDCDGFAPLTYATLHGRCDEIVLQMAIPVAKAVQAQVLPMFDAGNYEGCKRLLAKAANESLAAVPHFDLCLIQAALALDAKTACLEVLEYWAAFIALWGYFDPPEIVDDLQPKLRVPLGSYVGLTVRAKGEPLSYQWFCDDDPLNTCTRATLDVSESASPEDEGRYFCRITNWRGTVTSATLALLVLDDTVVVDPSARYYVAKDTVRPTDALFNVKATTGDVLTHAGVQLWVPPGSFEVFDLFDANLAATAGMDIVLAVDPAPATPERLVSPIVRLKPTGVDPFLTPWTLRLPHDASDDPNMELVVLERVIVDLDGNEAFRPVPAAHYRVAATHVDVDLVALGTFAVAQRGQDQDVVPKQRMTITLLIPRSIPLAPPSVVDVHAWVFPTRLDAVETMAATIAAETDVALLGTMPIELLGATKVVIRFNRATVSSHVDVGAIAYVGAVPLYLDATESVAKEGFGLVVKEIEVALFRGVLRERTYDRTFLVPVTYSPCVAPAQVRLVRHNPWGLQVAWTSPAQEDAARPCMAMVELAPFSKTFWDRYKDIWWFERGHLSIVHRIYRVVHKGQSPNNTIVFTDVHAAAVRVTILNQDHAGTYCDPVLVSPDTVDLDDDDSVFASSDLTQQHVSPTLHADQVEAAAMVAAVYVRSQVFHDLFGVPPAEVIPWLDAHKQEYRAVHYSVALLLAGLARLQDTAHRVPFHRRLCEHFVRAFGLLERVLPALDTCYGTEGTPELVGRLHAALQALFVAVHSCVSPGWLGRFLVADANAFHAQLSGVLEGLVSDVRDHPFFADVPALLVHWEGAREAFLALAVMDKDELLRLHAWSLLGKTTPPIKPALLASHLSTLFHVDVFTELQLEKVLAHAYEMATTANTLASRLLSVFPSDKEVVEHTVAVIVRLTGDVVDVDCLRFINVKNTTLGVRVHGAMSFDKVARTVTFIPTVPFEARSTFKLKLRAEAAGSWLGPLRSTLKLEFSTKPNMFLARVGRGLQRRFLSVAAKKRKVKVALVSGYLGTGFHGVQLQDRNGVPTVEDTLRSALFKAGCIRDSNFDDMNKIGWSRSSRTDKGVHASIIVFSGKLLVDDDSIDEATGRLRGLPETINAHLPETVRIFTATKVHQSFRAREDCLLREYEYFLPLSFLAPHATPDRSVDAMAQTIIDTLPRYEGIFDFHNFTKQRSSFYKALDRRGKGDALTDDDEVHEDDEDDAEDESRPRDISIQNGTRRSLERHRRTIYACRGSIVPDFCGAPYLRVHLMGASFLLNQIRCMVGAAIAVATGHLTPTMFEAALETTHIVRVPTAPAEGLVLASCSLGGKRPLISLQRDYNAPSELEMRKFTAPHRSLLAPYDLHAVRAFRNQVIYREVDRAWKESEAVARWPQSFALWQEKFLGEEVDVAALDAAVAARRQDVARMQASSFAVVQRARLEKDPVRCLPRAFATTLSIRFGLAPGSYVTDILAALRWALMEEVLPADATEDDLLEFVCATGLDKLAARGQRMRLRQ
ncbi:ubiquitin fusion degradation protein [Achlya hypogyna]|uniref:Ubiquitin fusion degradation protein n=1 Tax=Achlya hypogyna TaxID=1202772 RepID=A0A1V9Z3D6_ACHHY|nr:ubiquitin fusion degradation protein [Achlya hypogyna]